MSGSQHNPNGRQAQLGSSWSPLQLQMANLLARAPQAHMASERGVTWHTPTPPHLYHVPQPSPPDPLQVMKAGNPVFRHTATPPELYRHTPTPPDKHLLRHTPSPGEMKAGAALPPADLYAHLGPVRDKLGRPSELVPCARGVDLSLARGGAGAGAGALSVRDAPTINSLVARAAPRPPGARPPAARLACLLQRLAPPSVIVQPRAAPTPSPPSSEDSADSAGGPVRLPPAPALQNGASPAGPERRAPPASAPPPPLEPPVRRKTRSGSAETIDDIAAMIASTDRKVEEPVIKEVEKPAEPPVTIDKLKSVLASPEPEHQPEELAKSPPKPPMEDKTEQPPGSPVVEAAAAPRRRTARTSDSSSANVPVESPSEAKPAEPEAGERTAEPTAASFVEVENQLEKMFAGIEEVPVNQEGDQPVEKEKPPSTKARKRRKSAPTKGERKAARRSSRASTGEEKKRGKKVPGKKSKEVKDAYDSGSNASSSRSRGPYIQIRGPRDSPLSVNVINAATEEEGEANPVRRKDEFRNGLRTRGLHCSTLGLRYDATTPDATWLCAFCERGPHAAGLGDLFGPYPLDTDCDEYRAVDEAWRRRAGGAAWLHEACGVWAPGLLAAGARLWGLPEAVWSCRGTRCVACARGGATLACGTRGCRARAHVPCAAGWSLDLHEFRALCPRHTQPPS